MAHDTSPPDPPTIHPVLWVSFALCALIIVVLFVAFTHTTSTPHARLKEPARYEPLLFAPLEVDARQLAIERDRHHGEARLDAVGEDLAHLHQIVRKANLSQFPSADEQAPPDALQMQAELVFAADEVLPATGVRGFIAAGEPIFEACNEGLEQLLQALRLANLPLAEARTNPPHRRFQKYRENCGNALPSLLEHGLVSATGQWLKPYGPAIFEILNRFRWAHIAHARLPARLQLSPYEYRLMMRWRIEDPDAFPLQARREFLSQATELFPDYDSALAEALLDVEGKDKTFATERMRALHLQYPNNAEYLRRLRALEQSGAPEGVSSPTEAVVE
ncbi:MAG: hypothetical protein H0U74_11715 [Bradymonadaceae bacterium]|nr:hypothetical protein [Lujinxingiaceae bacterium]